MSTSLKPRLSVRRSSVCASRQDRRRSLTGSFWALIKRKTRLQQRLGAGANLAVGRRIVIVRALGRTQDLIHRKVLLHNDFPVWEFSYNCNGVSSFCLIRLASLTGNDMGTVSNIVARLREFIAIPGNPIRSLINKGAERC